MRNSRRVVVSIVGLSVGLAGCDTAPSASIGFDRAQRPESLLPHDLALVALLMSPVRMEYRPRSIARDPALGRPRRRPLSLSVTGTFASRPRSGCSDHWAMCGAGIQCCFLGLLVSLMAAAPAGSRAYARTSRRCQGAFAPLSPYSACSLVSQRNTKFGGNPFWAN